jgi:hypothetical protein
VFQPALSSFLGSRLLRGARFSSEIEVFSGVRSVSGDVACGGGEPYTASMVNAPGWDGWLRDLK